MTACFSASDKDSNCFIAASFWARAMLKPMGRSGPMMITSVSIKMWALQILQIGGRDVVFQVIPG